MLSLLLLLVVAGCYWCCYCHCYYCNHHCCRSCCHHQYCQTTHNNKQPQTTDNKMKVTPLQKDPKKLRNRRHDVILFVSCIILPFWRATVRRAATISASDAPRPPVDKRRGDERLQFRRATWRRAATISGSGKPLTTISRRANERRGDERRGDERLPFHGDHS